MRALGLIMLILALFVAGCGGGDDDDGDTAKVTPTPTQPAPEPTPEDITCDEAAYTPEPGDSYAHPSENFYPPDADNAPSPADLEHLIAADNAIVVTYPANAPEEALTMLSEWSARQTASVVLADPSPDAPPLRAKIATAQLTCDGVDEAQLQAFADQRGEQPVQPHDEDRE